MNSRIQSKIAKARRATRTTRAPIPGTLNVHILIPETLHEAMKAIRQARHELEGADVKLCRIYREAVEQYVQAKPQRQLVNGRTATA